MQDELSHVSEALVGRFRRQKPLRGGSLIVTIFGDSLLPRGGAIALGNLIRLAQPFGLNERLVRTASTRLSHEGWLQGRRVGKLSEYRLSKIGQERFREATERIYGEPNTPWTGRWTLIVVPGLKGTQRSQLRKDLDWQGFGEIAAGVFAHPEAREKPLDDLHWRLKLPARALVFNSQLPAQTAPQTLIDLGWDLAALSKRYRRFVERFEACLSASRVRGIRPEAAFITRTLLIHEYRRLHLRDPLLPRTLLPTDWPGTQAAGLCRAVYVNVLNASEEYLSQHAAVLSGPLPPSDDSMSQRFGGL